MPQVYSVHDAESGEFYCAAEEAGAGEYPWIMHAT